MKRLIIASAIIFSTGIASTTFAATAVKEKNTLKTGCKTAEKNTLGTADRAVEKNTLGTADRFTSVITLSHYHKQIALA